jgi:hypothetical protein
MNTNIMTAENNDVCRYLINMTLCGLTYYICMLMLQTHLTALQAAFKHTTNACNHLEPYNAPNKGVGLLSMPVQFLRHVVQ